MSFDKYAKYGAYHWSTTYPDHFWRYSPRLDASYSIVLQSLRRHLNPADRGPCTILDIACGDGVMTYKASQYGFSVVGLDLEALALQYARKELIKRAVQHVELIQASCAVLPFSDETADGIVAMELIEHLDDDTTTSFLHESKRVLKPNGVLILTTPHKRSEEMHSPYHVQEFSHSELNKCLATYFSRVEVLGYLSPFAQKLYFFGGTPLKPLRIIWKLLAKASLYNPYNSLTQTPTPQWENLIGIATKG